jgi:SAM-dependent methyltransferase
VVTEWPGKCQTGAVGIYADQLLPRVLDLAMRGGEFSRSRARVAAGLEGEVLEIGFGSGLNIPWYPPGLARVRAVDPATVGRNLAAKRAAACAVPIEYVGLDGEALPVGDACVDAVLSTWTLCTIPDVSRALAEIRRVLRPGGALHFAEHGLAPDAKVARLQQRLTPLQRRVVGGCHLNRRADPDGYLLHERPPRAGVHVRRHRDQGITLKAVRQEYGDYRRRGRDRRATT